MENIETEVHGDAKKSMRAVLTGMDTKPAMSLALMLESIGYEVFMLTDSAMKNYHKKGYTGGVEAALLKNMGYAVADIKPTESVEGDIFFDLKLKDLQSMLKIHPELNGALYVINGGWDDYEDYGNYFPTITNNFWIKNAFHVYSPMVGKPMKVKDKPGTEPPIDLLHNAYNWGFGTYLDDIIAKTGLRVFGSYGSPMGLIHNDDVEEYLHKTIAFVHIKSSDCPGWALWEAFATGTPVVVPSLFIKRMHFEDLYIDGETCVTWGDNLFEDILHEPGIFKEFIDREMPKAIEELTQKVEKLKDPEYNTKIGMGGHKKWKELTEWTEAKQQALKDYLNNYHAQV